MNWKINLPKLLRSTCCTFSITNHIECEEKCTKRKAHCALELYNFDNKCHLDCENENIKSTERKFEPIHGNQCDGQGICK